MDIGDWAKVGAFVWLGAYVVFFLGALLLNARERSTPRLLLVVGFALLVVVNLMLLAEYWDITNIRYSPIYEDSHYSSFMTGDAFPAWQRWYYWGGVALDVMGKSLAGIGFIMESRHQINRRRMEEYYSNLPTS